MQLHYKKILILLVICLLVQPFAFPRLPALANSVSDEEEVRRLITQQFYYDQYKDNDYKLIGVLYEDIDQDNKRELIKLNAEPFHSLRIEIHKNGKIARAYDHWDLISSLGENHGYNIDHFEDKSYVLKDNKLYIKMVAVSEYTCRAFCGHDNEYHHYVFEVSNNLDVKPVLYLKKIDAEYASPLDTYDENWNTTNSYPDNYPEYFTDWNGTDLSHHILRYYNIDNEEMTKQAYDQVLAKYDQWQWIDDSEDASSIVEKQMEEILVQLDRTVERIDSSRNIKDSMDYSVIQEINERLLYISPLESYSITEEMDTKELMAYIESLSNIMQSSKVILDENSEDKDYTKQIPVENVDSFLNEYLGRALPQEDFTIIDDTEWGYPYYARKGDYYFFTESFDGDFAYTSYINAIYELEEDVYYVDYSVLSYYGYISERFFEYVPEPYNYYDVAEKLPYVERVKLERSGDEYVVLKRNTVNGKNHWTFIEKNDITIPFDSKKEKRLKKIDLDPGQLGWSFPINEANNIQEIIVDLKSEIQNISLNEHDKHSVRDFISQAVQYNSQNYLPSNNNLTSISSSYLKKQTDLSEELYNQFDHEIEIEELHLLQEILLTNQISIYNIDPSVPIQIRIDNQDTEVIGNSSMNDTIIRFHENDYGVLIKGNTLNDWFSQYAYVDITLTITETSIDIQLQDENQNLLTLNTGEHLMVLIPVSSLSMNILHEDALIVSNVINESNKVIFPVRQSGEYVIQHRDKLPELSNIDEAARATLEKLEQMDVIDIDNKSFDPTAAVTRKEFSKAIVNLYSVLNEQVETTFIDVAKDDPYYPYIASGEQAKLLFGFKDGTFKGERNITLLQLLSISSRMLHESKKYLYPVNTDQYLNFLDIALVPKEEMDNVALAVQLGLIQQGGMLEPHMETTIVEVANILSKLFDLLYPSTSFTVPINEEALAKTMIEQQQKDGISKSTFIWVLSAAVSLILILALVIILLRKRAASKSITNA